MKIISQKLKAIISFNQIGKRIAGVNGNIRSLDDGCSNTESTK